MSGHDKSWLFRLQDMLDHIEKIRTYTKGKNQESFISDPVLQDAVVRNLEIVGEAARFVPKEAQDRYPQIEWDKVIGMRHKISHDYLQIDMRIVWNLIENDFFGLYDQIHNMVEQEDS